MYKCIIIDDEERSIENLSRYIKEYPDLEIVKSYTSPLEALREISESEAVDLIFMDVDMPVLTGVELAKIIRHKTKRLVFTTAHSKYAFDAYEIRAEAYLLKPFSFAKFVEEVNRILPHKISDKNFALEEPRYMLVKLKEESQKIIKVDFENVVCFESFGNYIKIHVTNSNEPIVSYLTLKDVLTLVETRNINYFVQVHRAFVISEIHIDSIQGNMIIMSNRKKIPTGGHFKVSLKNVLEKNLLITSRRTSK